MNFSDNDPNDDIAKSSGGSNENASSDSKPISVSSDQSSKSNPTETPTTSTPAVHTAEGDCIELRRLHRFFGKTKAVSDVTFNVRRGHVFGYIGPNGAGKTTSMRILATLDLPSYGDAYIDGFSVVNDPEFVRRRLGFMPDSFGTYRDVSCSEYLDFFARAYSLIGRERIERLKWVLNFTGTQGMADKPIRGLSKGMKQRLCLGRALVHDPAVMILDEPAAGLDPRARIELRRMIRELADRGKTILISSHILTELAEVCDSVGIIEQGQLLATGTVEEIQHQQADQIELVIRLLDRSEEAAKMLEPIDGVGKIIVDGMLLKFPFTGEPKDQADIVGKLVSEGFSVLEIVGHKKSLEDVFLQVTEGLVQ